MVMLFIIKNDRVHWHYERTLYSRWPLALKGPEFLSIYLIKDDYRALQGHVVSLLVLFQ